MNNTTKLLGAFVIGAMAGIAIAKLLESDQGKEFVENAREKAASAAGDIKARIKKLESELAELLRSESNSDATDKA